jgi:hypothetical protein
MRNSPFRNIMLWLTILALLWSSQGNGYVWCVTTDGPTHLESTLNSHCNQGERDACIANFDGEINSTPCVDLAATHDILQYRTVSGWDLGAPFLLSTLVRPQWAPPALVRYLSNNLILDLEPSPRIATTLLVHRSTVLLI